ncbi:MAG: M50 family metallopeptidase [Anaerolineae bacterium]
MSTLVEGLGNILGPVIGFIVGLIPLILVHEFGHLIVGKLAGVWAHEFGIGYPPRIVKLFRWKETDFTLNWLPFGGFVRFEGESTFADGEEDKDPEIKKHSLYAKPPWQRILVYLGGPVTNLLTAWLIAVVIFTTGIPQLRTIVTDVAPNSPAAAAELQAGDRIVAVNGADVGDTAELQAAIQESAGEPTTITVKRGDETLTITVVPRENPPEGEGAMGIAIQNEEVAGTLQHYPLHQSVLYGTRYFVNVSAMTVMLPVIIIRENIPFREARPVGVVGISQIAEQSVNQSIEQSAAYPFLRILMLLSISLGIFNLLPIPALDGGRILFSVIEAIRGKALTPELEERIHLVALLVMVVLFVAITVLDIVAPVQLN